MNCAVYKTNPSECLGSPNPLPLGEGRVREPGCLNRDKPGLANVTPSAQTSHVLRLNALRQAGAHFAIADLTAGEWMGLEALDQFKNNVGAQHAAPSEN